MNVLSHEESKTIRVEYELTHPPSKVWRALTEPALLAAWLMPNDMRAEVGHAFTFKTAAIGDWDGTVHCEVLEADAPKRLRYSWRGGAPAMRLDSVVTWSLTATENGGTRLTLEHAGFLPRNAFAFDAMKKGWTEKLAARIASTLDGLESSDR